MFCCQGWEHQWQMWKPESASGVEWGCVSAQEMDDLLVSEGTIDAEAQRECLAVKYTYQSLHYVNLTTIVVVCLLPQKELYSTGRK